jgi:hypothetical protein
MGIPSPDMLTRGKWTNSVIRLSLSTSQARNTTAFAQGVYQLTSDANCFVLQGSSTVAAAVPAAEATASAGNYLPAGVPMGPFYVQDAADAYFSAILSAGTGFLYISEWRT